MNEVYSDPCLSRLRRWIAEQASLPADEAVSDDIDLFEGGYIDSLGLISLILFVEQLRGAPVEAERMVAHNFSSLRQIVAVFFPDEARL